MNICHGARLALLAIGMGAGITAVAPLAWADTSIDSWGLGELGLAAAAPQGIVEPDFAISFDGYSLQDGTATANSASGDFGLAIAYGSGAHADAGGGFGDLAVADGTDTTATTAGTNGVGGGTLDVAVAQGAGSFAEADNGYLDAASASGNGCVAQAIGIGDVASASDDDSLAYAGQGDFNSALANGANSTAEASEGNSNIAVAVSPPGTTFATAIATGGNGNVASVWGGNGSAALSGGYNGTPLGDHDIATVIGNDSTALAGAGPTTPGSYDLGAVLFENGMSSQNATGGDYLYDIVTALGNETGSAAATSGTSFLTELASLF